MVSATWNHGLRLAYHYHTAEFLDESREFLHMMLYTTPENVGLCLDFHWAYRGLGNDLVAVEGLLDKFGDRAAVAHLRQSREGVIHEVLDDGDIDYRWAMSVLEGRSPKIPLILECGVDPETPVTMETAEALRLSREYLVGLLA